MALTRPSFTQLTTTITSFTDPITVLNQGASSPNVDVGFLFNRANGLVSNVALYWSESAQSFVTAYTGATGITNTNVTATSYANVRTGNITANGFFWSNGTVFSSGSTFTGGYVQNTIIAAANLVANSGTASSSNVTGALVVSGGIGVSGSINVGSNLVFSNGSNPGISKPLGVRMDLNNAGGLDANGPFWSGYHFNAPDGIVINGSTGYPRMSFYWNYNSATNPNNINFNMVAGNNATGGNANVSLGTDTAGYVRFLTNNAERLKIGGEGNVVATSTTISTSTTTGALVVRGGTGIAGALYIANTGDVSANIGAIVVTTIPGIQANLGTATTNITTLFSNAATQATSINSINANIGAYHQYANANLGTATTNITNLQSNAGTQQSQINSIVTNANANVAAYLPTYSGSLGGTLTTAAQTNITSVGTLTGLTSSGIVNITNSTQSNDNTTGALVVTGGAAVGANLHVGGSLHVTGNLEVNGTQTIFNTNVSVIEDSMIYLGDDNTGDSVDIGLVSSFTNPAYQHTGFVRDASDGVWKLFANVVAEPTTIVDFTSATYSNLRIGTLTASSAAYSGTVTVDGNLVVGGNVTLGNLLIDDTELILFDNADPTKKAQFNLSGLTTNNSVVYTLPPGSSNVSTLVDLVSTQTINGAKTFSGANQNFGSSTGAGTQQLAYGATTTGLTKTINIGTGGAQGSFTNMTIGPILGYGNVTFQGNSPVLITNTAASTSSTTGALEVMGGVGIVGQLSVGSNVAIGESGYPSIIYSSTVSSRTATIGFKDGYNMYVDSPNSGYLILSQNQGRVGIGTVSPAQNLHVSSTTDAVALVTGGSASAGYVAVNGNARSSLTGATILLSYSSGAAELTNKSNAALVFGTNDTERVRITADGNVVVASTTTSTSSTTGALVVKGGVGIAGNLNTGSTSINASLVGGTTSQLQINGDVTIAGANRSVLGNMFFQGGWKYAANGAAWGFREDNTGNLQVIAAPVNSSGALAAASPTYPITLNLTTGQLGIISTNPASNLSIGTTTSTSTATPVTVDLGGTFSSSAGSNGKLKVWYDGSSSYMGLGVSSGQLDYIVSSSTFSHVWYQGGSEKMRIAATSSNVVISTTTASTSSTTGALVVKGGVGIAGQMTVASNITLSESGGSGTRTVLSSSGSGAIINHNDNSDVFLQTQGNTRIQILNTSGIVSFPYGITANSSGIRSTFANIITTNGVYWANGAAYSSGGSFTGGYVASQSTFGANLVANSATNSTSNVTGAVVVAGAGGLGVGGNVYVGNRVGYVWGANSVSSAYTYFNSVTNSIDTVFG